MPIQAPRYPKSIPSAAALIISERIAAESGKGYTKRRGDLFILPVYGIRIASLAQSQFNLAALTGWRVIWIEERRRVGATLEFQRTKGGRPKFSTWSFGKKSVETVRTLVALSQSPAAIHNVCRPCILKVSALQVEALWLRVSGAPDEIFDLKTRAPIADFQARVAKQAEVAPPRRRTSR